MSLVKQRKKPTIRQRANILKELRRTIKELPTVPLYAESMLGHTHIIDPVTRGWWHPKLWKPTMDFRPD